MADTTKSNKEEVKPLKLYIEGKNGKKYKVQTREVRVKYNNVRDMNAAINTIQKGASPRSGGNVVIRMTTNNKVGVDGTQVFEIIEVWVRRSDYKKYLKQKLSRQETLGKLKDMAIKSNKNLKEGGIEVVKEIDKAKELVNKIAKPQTSNIDVSEVDVKNTLKKAGEVGEQKE